MTAFRFDLLPGDKVGKYTVIKPLGEGTYGHVFQVRGDGKKEYALKVLKLHAVIDQQDRDMITKRFRGEFKCGQLDSNFLVASREMGEYKGNPFIVMDFMPGKDLRARMADFKQITAVERMAEGILSGLDFLHGSGIIHRDIKPENVMLDQRDGPRLTDFGIAGFINARVTIPKRGRVRETFGTFAYIAPEQLNDAKKYKTTSPRTDIFSFGVMLYELLSQGRYPFGSLNDHAELAEYIKNASRGKMIDIRKYRPDTPDYLLHLLDRSLHFNYEERIGNVGGLLKILREGGSGRSINRIDTGPQEINKQYYSDLELVVVSGEDAHRCYNLYDYVQPGKPGLITIGFLDDEAPNRNHIEITERATAYISNFHATIEHHPAEETWLIRDGQHRPQEGRWKPSRNGVYVNNTRVPSNGARLYPGSFITLGDTTLRLRAKIPG